LEKISEDLTDAAREQSAEPLAKDKLNNKDRKVLQEAKDKLDQALTLKPDNGSAADLEKKVAEKLAADLTANGERDLGAAEKNSAADPGKAANKAEQALQKFEQASALTPGNERAEAGAAQAKAMLPGLLAADAARNTENAKASMQGSPSPSAADLQNAVGMLEKADAAMGRALALSADSGNTAQLQQQSSTVSGLLTDARGRLAAVMAETGLPADSNQSTGDDADGDVPPNTDGEEQEGDRTQPRSRMYSLQDLRTKLKNPKNEDNFWHQKYRDW
jgi:hypothetical protein